MKDDYAELLSLPHFVSRKHPPMSLMDRAAQFSPFAALVGFEQVLADAKQQNETAVSTTIEAVEQEVVEEFPLCIP